MVDIKLTYEDGVQRLNKSLAFEVAAQIWESYLDDDVTITHPRRSILD